MPTHPDSPGPPPRRAGREAQKTAPEIRIKLSWCKGCGLCVEACNRDVLKMDGGFPRVVMAERCSRCLQCEAFCPDFAIEVGDADSPAAADAPDPAGRAPETERRS